MKQAFIAGVALSQESVRSEALEELSAGDGVYYVSQERAMAPGMSGEWPEVIQHPTNVNGRLIKRKFNLQPVAWLFTNEEGDDDFGNNETALKNRHYKDGAIVPLYALQSTARVAEEKNVDSTELRK